MGRASLVVVNKMFTVFKNFSSKSWIQILELHFIYAANVVPKKFWTIQRAALSISCKVANISAVLRIEGWYSAFAGITEERRKRISGVQDYPSTLCNGLLRGPLLCY